MPIVNRYGDYLPGLAQALASSRGGGSYGGYGRELSDAQATQAALARSPGGLSWGIRPGSPTSIDQMEEAQRRRIAANQALQDARTVTYKGYDPEAIARRKQTMQSASFERNLPKGLKESLQGIPTDIKQQALSKYFQKRASGALEDEETQRRVQGLQQHTRAPKFLSELPPEEQEDTLVGMLRDEYEATQDERQAAYRTKKALEGIDRMQRQGILTEREAQQARKEKLADLEGFRLPRRRDEGPSPEQRFQFESGLMDEARQLRQELVEQARHPISGQLPPGAMEDVERQVQEHIQQKRDIWRREMLGEDVPEAPESPEEEPQPQAAAAAQEAGQGIAQTVLDQLTQPEPTEPDTQQPPEIQQIIQQTQARFMALPEHLQKQYDPNNTIVGTEEEMSGILNYEPALGTRLVILDDQGNPIQTAVYQ